MPTRNELQTIVQRELRALRDENRRLKLALHTVREERDTAYDDGYSDGYADGTSDHV